MCKWIETIIKIITSRYGPFLEQQRQKNIKAWRLPQKIDFIEWKNFHPSDTKKAALWIQIPSACKMEPCVARIIIYWYCWFHCGFQCLGCSCPTFFWFSQIIDSQINRIDNFLHRITALKNKHLWSLDVFHV